jgi:Bacteriophage CI repressor helix-turn-helix domain
LVKLKDSPQDFWMRVVTACGTDNVSVIARKAGTTVQGIYKWQGKSWPKANTLIRIAHSTGVSLHWLLVGEGPKERDILRAYDENKIDYRELQREAVINFLIAQIKILLNEHHGEVGGSENFVKKSPQG